MHSPYADRKMRVIAHVGPAVDRHATTLGPALHLSLQEFQHDLVLSEHACVGFEHQVNGFRGIEWPSTFGMGFAEEASPKAIALLLEVFEVELLFLLLLGRHVMGIVLGGWKFKYILFYLSFICVWCSAFLRCLVKCLVGCLIGREWENTLDDARGMKCD